MNINENASDTSRPTLSSWWQSEKENITQGRSLEFLLANKIRLENSLTSIYSHNLIYRTCNSFLALITALACMIDKSKDFTLKIILQLPAPKLLKETIQSLVDAVNFEGMCKFITTKIYSLKKAPQNSQVIHAIDEIITHARHDGFDLKKYFPTFAQTFSTRKNHLLQHSFYKEFSKSTIERLLAAPFAFNQSIIPVLPDSTLLHKLFVYMENFFMIDLILVDQNGKKVSAIKDSKEALEASEAMQTLKKVAELKASGKRVFMVGHHEGYVGPYFLRTLLRRLGFDELGANCNTVIGPRMLSNIVLKNISSNVGNAFLILPSQKTKAIEEKNLADALIANSRRTQFLIKMPNSGLKLIEEMTYQEFMDKLVNSNAATISRLSAHLCTDEQQTLIAYFEAVREKNALVELEQSDFELFKKIMYEPFLLFPEGTRSYVDDKGDVTIKYINPRYMQAYMRPGDFILPVNLTGGSEALKGIRLCSATCGFSAGQPYEVSAEMIDNFQEEGVNVMRQVAALPNIKHVYFDEAIQAGKKFNPKTSKVER